MKLSSIAIRRRTVLLMLAAFLTAIPSFGRVAQAGGDWNDSGIAWTGYEEGLERAKADGKPVCLILYTEWCPHCTRYAEIFHDAGVVEMSKKFVMIRLDKDKNAELSAKYAPDGEYIPRTFFLTKDGKLQADITEARANYKYFYDTKKAGALLRSMKKALGE